MNIFRLHYLMVLILMALLTACGSKPEQKLANGQKRFEVKKVPVQKELHFTGNIQPLHENSITVPASAVIESINYKYGQWVKKGDVILTLNSSDLQKQYNDTLTEYLKAKDNYSIARTKFNGTQELWAAGLLSKNNYISERSSLDNARVTLMQVTRKLTEMLEKMDEETVPDIADLSELSFSEFDKVRKALSTRHNLIHIKAPVDGILLYPPKTTDESLGSMRVGNTVKADQVIALVGDLSGLRVEIDVPEIEIDKVYTGMNATVNVIAFGKEQLPGQLISINAQASTGSNNQLPSFPAVVEVKHLTTKQRAYFKIGMSAAVELSTESKDQLLVPISALSQKSGQTLVNVLEKSGKVASKVVTTGAAQADKVTITSGLKEGDVVLYG